jgi:hypothetical protein
MGSMSTDKAILHRLVVSTLFDLERPSRDTCFTVNVSGMKLLDADAAVIPIIESLIRTVIEPVIDRVGGKGNERVAELVPATHPLDGLDYVLGAYLVLCSKYAAKRGIDFLRRCSAPVQAEAISCVPSFFRIVDGHYNFRVAPAKELLDFVETARVSSDERVRAAAEHTLASLE